MSKKTITVKEEPADVDYSPFFLLNELGQGAIIKHESQEIIKTEITVGAEYDEECTVLKLNDQTADSEDLINMDCVTTPNKVFMKSSNPLEHDLSDTDLLKEPCHNAMKMVLPGKYKTLFDGVKAFPEMSKEILPILEELIHFHNCICLLRTDLNLQRCVDCGRGFADLRRLRSHERHCVVQKLENRFAPANISEHIGSSFDVIAPEMPTKPPENPTREDKNVVAEESSAASEIKQAVTSTVAVKKENIDESLQIRVTHDIDGNMLISKKTGKRRRVNKKEKNEFEAGTSWGILNKTECSRIAKVLEINQFNHRTIYPYHVFRYSGEVVYHSPICISYKDEFGTAQNVFNTMISSIAEVGRLVPSLKGRVSYGQVLQKHRKEQIPELELLATPPKQPTTASTLKYKKSSLKKEKEKLKVLKIGCPNMASSTKSKKIKIVCDPISRINPNTIHTASRRTKTAGAEVPNLQYTNSNQENCIVKGKNTGKTVNAVKFGTLNLVPRKPQMSGKDQKNDSCFDFQLEHTTKYASLKDSVPLLVDDPCTDTTESSSHDQSHISTLLSTPRETVKYYFLEYMNEESYVENYALFEADVNFLNSYIAGSQIDNNATKKRAQDLLNKFKSTIPNSSKQSQILQLRDDFMQFSSEAEYPKYGISASDDVFLTNFIFGVANPVYREIARAKYILNTMRVRKLRLSLRKYLTSGIIQKLPFSSKLFLDKFVVKQIPDMPTEVDMKFAQYLLQFLEGSISETEGHQDSSKLSVKVTEGTDNELSSPEVMRSSNENVFPLSVRLSPPHDIPKEENSDIKSVKFHSKSSLQDLPKNNIPSISSLQTLCDLAEVVSADQKSNCSSIETLSLPKEMHIKEGQQNNDSLSSEDDVECKKSDGVEGITLTKQTYLAEGVISPGQQVTSKNEIIVNKNNTPFPVLPLIISEESVKDNNDSQKDNYDSISEDLDCNRVVVSTNSDNGHESSDVTSTLVCNAVDEKGLPICSDKSAIKPIRNDKQEKLFRVNTALYNNLSDLKNFSQLCLKNKQVENLIGKRDHCCLVEFSDNDRGLEKINYIQILRIFTKLSQKPVFKRLLPQVYFAVQRMVTVEESKQMSFVNSKKEKLQANLSGLQKKENKIQTEQSSVSLERSDIFDVFETDSSPTKHLPIKRMSLTKRCMRKERGDCVIDRFDGIDACDYADGSCSKSRVQFGHPRVFDQALGPCLTLCRGHYELLSDSKDAWKDEVVRLPMTRSNRMTDFVLDKLADFKKLYSSAESQTEEVHLKIQDETDDVRRLLVEENKEAQSKIDGLHQLIIKQSAATSDLDQQLKAERSLRRMLKTESDTLAEANKQFTSVKIDLGETDLQMKLEKLRKENDKLKENNSKLEQEVKSLQTSEIGVLRASLEKLQQEKEVLQSTNSNLQQTVEDKKEEVKSLEVSMQSVSEALRHQTKTISSLSRKTDGSLLEQHNHKVYTGYESLVAITCKVLGAKLEMDGTKIEDPVKMRGICEDIAGEDNLFALFMRVFCSNNVCTDQNETLSIEKRVLFLINLMAYFYTGSKESNENEPSSSSLQELL